MLVLAAKCVQLVQDRIYFVLQAGDALVKSPVAARRAGHWGVRWSELWTARTKSSTKASSATAASSKTAAEAALRSTRRLWAVVGSAGFWAAIIRSTITGSTITGLTRFRS